MSDITYDFDNEMWLDKTKTSNFYAFDYRGQGEPTGSVETKATVIFSGDVITRIEFESVPENLRTPRDEDEREKHQRASGALVERERIIALLEAKRDEAANEVTFPPSEDTLDSFVYAQQVHSLIELIKGEQK